MRTQLDIRLPEGWRHRHMPNVGYQFINPRGEHTATIRDRQTAIYYAMGIRDGANGQRPADCPDHPDEHSNTCPTCSEWRLA